MTIGGKTDQAALAQANMLICALFPDVRQCTFFIPLQATTLGGLWSSGRHA